MAVLAGSVDEALRLLGGEAVSLVLADELMPGRGGLDLLAALRADARYEKLPFVLLSLFGSENEVEIGAHRPDAIGAKAHPRHATGPSRGRGAGGRSGPACMRLPSNGNLFRRFTGDASSWWRTIR